MNPVDSDDEEKQFDFLISGELLRTSLGDHLKERLISNETVVEIECIEKNAPPIPHDMMEHSDWVSCVNCNQK